MKEKLVRKRRGVSPVIAVLLLIAIAVATGILVYVWVTGLAGTLTQTGGAQVVEQLSLASYDFKDLSTPKLVLWIKNTGSVSVTIRAGDIYFDGSLYTVTINGTSSMTVGVGQTVKIIITGFTAPTPQTSHVVKIITTTGGVFEYTVVAGRAS